MEILERSLGDVGFLALSGDLIESSAYSQGAISLGTTVFTDCKAAHERSHKAVQNWEALCSNRQARS